MFIQAGNIAITPDMLFDISPKMLSATFNLLKKNMMKDESVVHCMTPVVIVGIRLVLYIYHITMHGHCFYVTVWLVGWLVVFHVPTTVSI